MCTMLMMIVVAFCDDADLFMLMLCDARCAMNDDEDGDDVVAVGDDDTVW